ncbi:uncharacterized protein LOC109611567 [Ooceraea biroi]|uniref:Uncharacterized protein n=1 Tax=Ooceraea biroi TaxID=2015173 RepID=A0A026WY05_OOCBI|nr:uncharacterized protein LOC109611567 [Ooceraea biroi]EZA60698.1 hypothetical protein X777_11357 [Ooceraea biroi]
MRLSSWSPSVSVSGASRHLLLAFKNMKVSAEGMTYFRDASNHYFNGYTCCGYFGSAIHIAERRRRCSPTFEED